MTALPTLTPAEREPLDPDLHLELCETFMVALDGAGLWAAIQAVVNAADLGRGKRSAAKQREQAAKASRELDAVARECGVSVERMRSGERGHRVSPARYVAMWVLRMGGMTLEQVGEVMGCHHVTVWNAIRTMQKRPELLDRAVSMREQLDEKQRRAA